MTADMDSSPITLDITDGRDDDTVSRALTRVITPDQHVSLHPDDVTAHYLTSESINMMPVDNTNSTGASSLLPSTESKPSTIMSASPTSQWSSTSLNPSMPSSAFTQLPPAGPVTSVSAPSVVQPSTVTTFVATSPISPSSSIKSTMSRLLPTTITLKPDQPATQLSTTSSSSPTLPASTTTSTSHVSSMTSASMMDSSTSFSLLSAQSTTTSISYAASSLASTSSSSSSSSSSSQPLIFSLTSSAAFSSSFPPSSTISLSSSHSSTISSSSPSSSSSSSPSSTISSSSSPSSTISSSSPPSSTISSPSSTISSSSPTSSTISSPSSTISSSSPPSSTISSPSSTISSSSPPSSTVSSSSPPSSTTSSPSLSSTPSSTISSSSPTSSTISYSSSASPETLTSQEASPLPVSPLTSYETSSSSSSSSSSSTSTIGASTTTTRPSTLRDESLSTSRLIPSSVTPGDFSTGGAIQEASGLSGGAVAGIILGLLAFLMVIFALIWLISRRFRGKNPHLRVRYQKEGRGSKHMSSSSLYSSADTISVSTDMYLMNPFRHDTMYLSSGNSSIGRNSTMDAASRSRPPSLLAHEDAVFFTIPSPHASLPREESVNGTLSLPEVNGAAPVVGTNINNNEIKGGKLGETCVITNSNSLESTVEYPRGNRRDSTFFTLEIPNTSLDLWQDIVAVIRAGSDSTRPGTPNSSMEGAPPGISFTNDAFQADEAVEDRKSSDTETIPLPETTGPEWLEACHELSNGVPVSNSGHVATGDWRVSSQEEPLQAEVPTLSPSPDLPAISLTDDVNFDFVNHIDHARDSGSVRSFAGSELSDISGDSFDVVEV